VHRVGQYRNVYVERVVIANTIEDRVLALQRHKRNLADGSLGEGPGGAHRRTSRHVSRIWSLMTRARRDDCRRDRAE
jgi:SNF2 family DNA or RNA helicase